MRILQLAASNSAVGTRVPLTPHTQQWVTRDNLKTHKILTPKANSPLRTTEVQFNYLRHHRSKGPIRVIKYHLKPDVHITIAKNESTKHLKHIVSAKSNFNPSSKASNPWNSPTGLLRVHSSNADRPLPSPRTCLRSPVRSVPSVVGFLEDPPHRAVIGRHPPGQHLEEDHLGETRQGVEKPDWRGEREVLSPTLLVYVASASWILAPNSTGVV